MLRFDARLLTAPVGVLRLANLNGHAEMRLGWAGRGQIAGAVGSKSGEIGAQW
jgi:hypothetical protein